MPGEGIAKRKGVVVRVVVVFDPKKAVCIQQMEHFLEKNKKKLLWKQENTSLSNSVFRYHLPKLIPPWELSHIPDSSRHFSR